MGLQDTRVPAGKSRSAALASLKESTQDTALPLAIHKRRQEDFVVSDWEFTKLWWRQT